MHHSNHILGLDTGIPLCRYSPPVRLLYRTHSDKAVYRKDVIDIAVL